jgi:Lar family restriction alleviation protein
LKPCPFCGAKVSIEHVTCSDEAETYGYWSIECAQHEAQTGLFCGVHADSEAEAIAAWNRRALPEWYDEETLARISTWFNAWLKEPIGERDRVLISHTIYALQHPADVKRAVERAKHYVEEPADRAQSAAPQSSLPQGG